MWKENNRTSLGFRLGYCSHSLWGNKIDLWGKLNNRENKEFTHKVGLVKMYVYVLSLACKQNLKNNTSDK